MSNGAKSMNHKALSIFFLEKYRPLVCHWWLISLDIQAPCDFSTDWLTFLLNWIKTGSGQLTSPSSLLSNINYAHPCQNNLKSLLSVWLTTKFIVKITVIWVK